VLEEQHVMPTANQFAHQSAIRRRVAVAPGARDRQADDDDPQPLRLDRAAGCSLLIQRGHAKVAFSDTAPVISSSSAARWSYVCSDSTRRSAAWPIRCARGM